MLVLPLPLEHRQSGDQATHLRYCMGVASTVYTVTARDRIRFPPM